MCLSPVTIKNPNYKKPLQAAYFKDITSQFIKVPCGYCSQCIANKQMQLVQRIQCESLTSHLFFCTLTYNELLPKITTSTGFDIPFVDFRDLQNMFKLLRKYNDFGRPFKYIAVSEKGSKKGRPHIHIIFSVHKCKSDSYNDIINLEKTMFDSVLKRWCKNIGSKRKPIYVPLLTYVNKFYQGRQSYNYDLHYINPRLSNDGSSDVGFYVLKYMLKPSAKAVNLQRALRLNLPDDEYLSTWSLVRPRLVKSHNFGLPGEKTPFGDYQIDSEIINHIKSGIHFNTKVPYPTFINPVSGQTFPLSRYYRSKSDLYTYDDANRVFLRSHNPNDLIVATPDNYTTDERARKLNKKLELAILLDSKNDVTDIM